MLRDSITDGIKSDYSTKPLHPEFKIVFNAVIYV
jgi:hypothetical protein